MGEIYLGIIARKMRDRALIISPTQSSAGGVEVHFTCGNHMQCCMNDGRLAFKSDNSLSQPPVPVNLLRVNWISYS
jgi:hypothetical protein